MFEVKIKLVTINIPDHGPMGIGCSQTNSYLALYCPLTGKTIPDHGYTLSQGGEERRCDVSAGKVRGAEWIDDSKPIFIVV